MEAHRLKTALSAAVLALAAAGAGAAPSMPSVRVNCALEIGVMCSGQADLACLEKRSADLTSRCKAALRRMPRHGAAYLFTNIPGARDAFFSLKGAARVPGAGNVWFKDGYAGPGKEFAPRFRAAVEAEAPGALRDSASLLGQSAYASSFPRPLLLRLEYDATQRNGLAHLDAGWKDGQLVAFNLAHWEDCPSSRVLGSVARHEFAHAVLHEAVGRTSRVPQWLDEGLGMLAGGEPSEGIIVDGAYYRFGRGYPGELACRLDNDGPGLQGGGLLTDCYPYYLIAVRRIAESSPDALPKLVADLRAGVPVKKAVEARTGLSWAAFEEDVDARVRRAFKWKSPLSWVTGRGWWRQVRWCRGSAS